MRNEALESEPLGSEEICELLLGNREVSPCSTNTWHKKNSRDILVANALNSQARAPLDRMERVIMPDRHLL